MLKFKLTFIVYINGFKIYINNRLPTREHDYYKKLSLALPGLFSLNQNWCIVPQFVLKANYSTDY